MQLLPVFRCDYFTVLLLSYHIRERQVDNVVLLQGARKIHMCTWLIKLNGSFLQLEGNVEEGCLK